MQGILDLFVYIFLFVVWPMKFSCDCLPVSLIIKSRQSTESQSGEHRPGPELPCSRPALLRTLSWPRFNRGWPRPRPPSDQWTRSGATSLQSPHCKHARPALLHPQQKNGLIAFIWWELLPSWWCNMICQCWQVFQVKLLMCTIIINSRKCNLNSSLNFDIIQEYSSKI